MIIMNVVPVTLLHIVSDVKISGKLISGQQRLDLK